MVVQLQYSRKYWLSIKFGDLAVGKATVKFKYDYACACVHIICMELPPNLNPPIFLFRPLGTKPPNLKIANISGYTVWYIAQWQASCLPGKCSLFTLLSIDPIPIHVIILWLCRSLPDGKSAQMSISCCVYWCKV